MMSKRDMGGDVSWRAESFRPTVSGYRLNAGLPFTFVNVYLSKCIARWLSYVVRLGNRDDLVVCTYYKD